MIKALALIVGPILCGVALFLIEAPAQAPGVYVADGESTYRLSGCDSGTSPGAGAPTALPVSLGEVLSFFIVVPDNATAHANAVSARLFLGVVNHTEPRRDDARTALATTVHRMNPRVYRVTSNQRLWWGVGRVTSTAYREALSHMEGNRATTELLVELDVPARPSGLCRYSVSLGVPPDVPVREVRWFVPPPEKGQ